MRHWRLLCAFGWQEIVRVCVLPIASVPKYFLVGRCTAFTLDNPSSYYYDATMDPSLHFPTLCTNLASPHGPTRRRTTPPTDRRLEGLGQASLVASATSSPGASLGLSMRRPLSAKHAFSHRRPSRSPQTPCSVLAYGPFCAQVRDVHSAFHPQSRNDFVASRSR